MSKRTQKFKRREKDFYATPYRAVPPLLPYLKNNCKFIEATAGNGQLIDHLVKHGHECLGAFDIEPKRDDITEYDMLNALPSIFDEEADYIITNPPWRRDLLIPLVKFFSSVKPTFLLFDSDFLFTKKTGAPEVLPFCHYVIPTPRLKWIPDSKHSATDNTAWYMFDQTTENKNAGPVVMPRG